MRSLGKSSRRRTRRPASRRLFLENLESRLLLAANWQNSFDEMDVNDDGFISPVDALIVINDVNARGARELGAKPADNKNFIDVNGDGQVAPVDALQVINVFIAGTRTNLVALTEGENFVVEGSRLVQLASDTGSRTIRFDSRTRSIRVIDRLRRRIIIG